MSDLDKVKKDGGSLRYIKNQTPEICLAAVQKDGWALGYVENQSPEICFAALDQDYERASVYVKNKNILKLWESLNKFGETNEHL